MPRIGLSIQPPCHTLCECVVTKYLGICSDPPKRIMLLLPWSRNVVADHREAVVGCWFRLSAFPLDGKVFCRTAGTVKGTPTGAAKRTLYREDRSAIMAEEGKQREMGSGRF